ncbi:degT/DnrJ/EryC1/StrS aminotransferase family protein [Ehrlichia chaffeensis str. Heartland]|uniref:Aminotransferase n=1 Tax=Ehrlichia chaffeensis (strain ATCC CRL-10679 / Arkansas) TaxID=205920 RepID=Q2GG99_EHRCR|nr:pyridoxal phosphate-dependent aminotransferase [Ehrlichia chaffeensis]ABD44949.1 aspartate aminotransferase [Ehrlichia chaffeensis str. Arkansas]AHX03800.1 degT/DnrJ/EryC1/StrS aminotransferase family protein [Ehrlichia chaffeensis str. Heartland]AHX05474.1 degT/DnrJ/EryC1/StrS aminotransferase family protein [Ehrlichia chaffeensis str. Jax]AHX06462.1 degT/DnrJ/EryC1/StrS aminotransferase family protein [Ehrlichia chaffeensis str. Liberty]AHX07452.1 degT/DnrJ/EryC1/StrS aminotransferase fam
MSLIAERMGCIKPSPTLEIANQAQKLKMSGVDVISLSAGEPDFDTPQHIKQAAIDAINSGKTKYTAVNGIIELKKVIIDRFKQDHDLIYNVNQISVGNGAKQCIYNLFMATINSGDEVIIPSPYWVSYPDVVKISGGNPVIVDCGETFKLTPDILESVITEKTKWLIMNSPNNPTGLVYTYEELKSIAEVLLKYPNIYVMTDDIYSKIIYDDLEFFTIAQVEPRLYDRVFTINGVSKAYAMTGWRIGYIAGDSRVISAISVIQSQSTTNPNSIAQFASIQALAGDQEFLKERNKIFAARRDMMVDMVNNTSLLSVKKPQGAFYVFISCKKLIGKSTRNGLVINSAMDFTKYLLEDYNVAVVPGEAFGAQGFFRISYATSTEHLSKACDRILDACGKLS